MTFKETAKGMVVGFLIGLVLALVWSCATITNNFDGNTQRLVLPESAFCPVYDELAGQWVWPPLKFTQQMNGDQFIDRPTSLRDVGAEATAGASGSPVALQGPASGEYAGPVGNQTGRTTETGPPANAGPDAAAVIKEVPDPGE